jgi:hypothetical protein
LNRFPPAPLQCQSIRGQHRACGSGRERHAAQRKGIEPTVRAQAERQPGIIDTQTPDPFTEEAAGA